MKIILNKCYGGFDVSDEAYELYAKKKGISLYRYYADFKNGKMRKGSDLVTYYFTKDFGDNVKKNEIDWTTNLYLDYGHRDDPTLIKVVEELGIKASGRCGELKVVEIPDGMDYVINDYDGIETLHEKVREW